MEERQARDMAMFRVAGVAFVVCCLVATAVVVDAGDEHRWVDAEGRTVPESTIGSFAGDEHCGWEGSTWITLAGVTYLKDPEGVVRGSHESYGVVDGLPEKARDSGLRRGGTELWTNPEEMGEAIYMVTGDSVERLPRTTQGCD